VPIGALALGAGAAFGVSLAMHAAMLWVSAVSYSFFLPICLTFLIASMVGHTFVRGLDRLTHGKRGKPFQIAIGSAIGLSAVLVAGYALLDSHYFTEEAALVGFFGVVVAKATIKQLR
jgi:predicted PurR-regulated permease PerM